MGPFIPNLSSVAAPLRSLTRKDAIFKWPPAAKVSFDRIKRARERFNGTLVFWCTEARCSTSWRFHDRKRLVKRSFKTTNLSRIRQQGTLTGRITLRQHLMRTSRRRVWLWEILQPPVWPTLHCRVGPLAACEHSLEAFQHQPSPITPHSYASTTVRFENGPPTRCGNVHCRCTVTIVGRGQRWNRWSGSHNPWNQLAVHFVTPRRNPHNHRRRRRAKGLEGRSSMSAGHGQGQMYTECCRQIAVVDNGIGTKGIRIFIPKYAREFSHTGAASFCSLGRGHGEDSTSCTYRRLLAQNLWWHWADSQGMQYIPRGTARTTQADPMIPSNKPSRAVHDTPLMPMLNQMHHVPQLPCPSDKRSLSSSMHAPSLLSTYLFLLYPISLFGRPALDINSPHGLATFVKI